MPNCGTMIGKSTPDIFDALHSKLKKKKNWHRNKVITDTLEFNPKFSLSILDFLSKNCLQAEEGYSTNRCRATRTIITQFFFFQVEEKSTLVPLRFNILFFPMLLS